MRPYLLRHVSSNVRMYSTKRPRKMRLRTKPKIENITTIHFWEVYSCASIPVCVPGSKCRPHESHHADQKSSGYSAQLRGRWSTSKLQSVMPMYTSVPETTSVIATITSRTKLPMSVPRKKLTSEWDARDLRSDARGRASAASLTTPTTDAFASVSASFVASIVYAAARTVTTKREQQLSGAKRGVDTLRNEVRCE